MRSDKTEPSGNVNGAALVTGASGGIGRAFAEVLAGHHYDLILTARRGTELKKIQLDLKQRYGVRIETVAADLTDELGIETLHRQLELRELRPEILVNNAGMGDWGLFAQSDWGKQQRMLQLNIAALTHLTRIVLPDMLERRRGKILNVASTAAFQPGPLMSVYYASKAYVLSFSQALSNEVRDKGVTVTCFCPGPTATDFQEVAGIKNIRLTGTKQLPGPLDVARCGYDALLKGKTVAVHGSRNRWLAFSTRFFPADMVTAGVRFLQDVPPERKTTRVRK